MRFLICLLTLASCAHVEPPVSKDLDEPTEQERVERWGDCLESGQEPGWCVQMLEQ